MDKCIIGKRIKETRMVRNMTREKLAAESGISVTFIYEIEVGKKSFSVDTLVNLSKALDVAVDYILYGNINEYQTDESGEAIANNKLLHVQMLLAEALNDIKGLINTWK